VRPVDRKELVKLCESEGCRYDRERGDHYIMVRDGMARPIVIPKKKDLKEDIVLGIGRTLGLKRKELEERLKRRPRRAADGKTE
jgi:predicted RNA binding protein YcfA (HicA-like mRNA interferase family)